MTSRQRLRASCALVAVTAMLQSQFAFASQPVIELGQQSSAAVAAQVLPLSGAPALTHAAKVALLQKRVKYVFVLFQENRAFDFHLGTFPGANGLFSQPAAQTPGFTQQIVNSDGSAGSISPFLIPQTVTDVNGNTVPLYPADTDSVDHSHTGIDNSLDVQNGVARNDRYALDEEGLTTLGGQIVSTTTKLPPTSPPTEQRKQYGELAMSHIDCDTVPFLWEYADRFALFDNFHQTVIGPSTPNAIAMIAGQSGATQWALHPSEGSNNTASPVVAATGGLPVVADPGPYPGSNYDTSPFKPPYGPHDVNPATPTLNQTYATLPLSFMGSAIGAIVSHDENPALDLADVQQDIATIASKNPMTVPWGWYQQGYDHEPTDGSGAATHADYITHHNGPQYFGYIGDNRGEARHLHGLGDFFSDISAHSLAKQGGVFYVRGGYGNLDGLKPLDPNPTVQANTAGDDDHPGYSDAQISEGLLADEVNAIAASPYWKDSAIIITYDETDGLYDHTLPKLRSLDPEGNPLDGGPRIPAIVISPYSRAHSIVHAYGEHSSVIKFIDELFNLVPLADLPDEVRGRKLGKSEFGQSDLGPADAHVPYISDMTDAFDDSRLLGNAPRLPAEYATIPASAMTLPQYGGHGCTALNIVRTDYVGGKLIDPAPTDFNPRPGTTPGVPTSGTWTP